MAGGIEMDTVITLARDLAAAHPVIDDVLRANAETWTHVLEWAANPAARVHQCARKLLMGARAELGLRPANDSLVSRLSIFIDGTHSGVGHDGNAFDAASSQRLTAVAGDTDDDPFSTGLGAHATTVRTIDASGEAPV